MNLYWTIACALCFGVGFLAGYFECKIQRRVKDTNEAIRLAVTSTGEYDE